MLGSGLVRSRIFALALLVFCAPLVTFAQNSSGSRRVVAPYLDMGKPDSDLPTVQGQSGTRWTTLAFLNAGEGCQPAWPSMKSLEADAKIYSSVAQARKQGGHIILAFGGYQGSDLAMACPDAKSLANAYLQAARHYKPEILDFDVEHAALEDQASIDRRSEALAILTKSVPQLHIQFTFPATQHGLSPECLNVLQSALKHRVRIYRVNVMAMDYAIPMPNGGMGAAAISAVDATREQLRQLGLETQLGITPMIGVNDSPGETFTLEDAQRVLDYALQHRDVTLLAFWSLGRDNGSCSGIVSPNCSGIAQQWWAFTRIFLNFR